MGGRNNSSGMSVQTYNAPETVVQLEQQQQQAAPPEPQPEPKAPNYNEAFKNGQDGYSVITSFSEAEKAVGFGNGGAADTWELNLSMKQKSAVESYTGFGYTPMNDALRKGSLMYADADLKAKIQSLKVALSKYNLPKPMVMHRGTGADTFGLPKNATTQTILKHIKSLVGGELIDKGFTSSSVAEAYSFASNNKVVMHIQTPAGKGAGAFVSGLSAVGTDENEFLFNSGSHFRILGAYEKDGKVHVNARWEKRDG